MVVRKEYEPENVLDGNETQRFLDETEITLEEVYSFAESVEDLLKRIADEKDRELDGNPRDVVDVMLASCREYQEDYMSNPNATTPEEGFEVLKEEIDAGGSKARGNISFVLGQLAATGRFRGLVGSMMRDKYSQSPHP